MTTSDSSNEHDNRYRLGLPEWLHQQVDSGVHKNVIWIDEKENIFQIPWKHASMNCWEDQDASLFKAWAVYTNRYREGVDEPKHKQWKSNFRCAINSHNRVFFVKEQDRGRIANRRVIRIVNLGKSEKKYESRVPKRKLYRSSRSKTKDDSSDTRVLNSIETLENCAKLLLSLKRSSRTGSNSSTISNISLVIDPENVADTHEDNDATNDTADKIQIVTETNVDQDEEPFDVARVKDERDSIWEDDNVGYAVSSDGFMAQERRLVPKEQSMASPIKEPSTKNKSLVKDHLQIYSPEGKPFVSETSYSYRLPNGSNEPGEVYIKYPISQVSQSFTKNDPIATHEIKAPMKSSIPTTVIVTINNNFLWPKDPGVDENKDEDSNGGGDNNEKITDAKDHLNSDDDDDLIMPREWLRRM